MHGGSLGAMEPSTVLSDRLLYQITSTWYASGCDCVALPRAPCTMQLICTCPRSSNAPASHAYAAMLQPIFARRARAWALSATTPTPSCSQPAVDIELHCVALHCCRESERVRIERNHPKSLLQLTLHSSPKSSVFWLLFAAGRASACASSATTPTPSCPWCATSAAPGAWEGCWR